MKVWWYQITNNKVKFKLTVAALLILITNLCDSRIINEILLQPAYKQQENDADRTYKKKMCATEK